MSRLLERPLAGTCVSLSISESGDSAERGFPGWQVNRVTIQIVAALMGQGAGVVFGHDWREDGVMEAVHAFALQMQPPYEMDGAAAAPLMRNLLPWPDEPRLTERERHRLASTLSIEQAGLPRDVSPVGTEVLGEVPWSYRRARGLTHLRRRLTELTHARLCIGGRTSGSKGRYPGIVEEAFLSVVGRQPLFLVGLLGGATRQVIDALEGGGRPVYFGGGTELAGVYEAYSRGRGSDPDAQIDPLGVLSAFEDCGIRGLSKVNSLAVEENRELFHTPAVDRAIELVLLGLGRLRGPGKG